MGFYQRFCHGQLKVRVNDVDSGDATYKWPFGETAKFLVGSDSHLVVDDLLESIVFIVRQSRTTDSGNIGDRRRCKLAVDIGSLGGELGLRDSNLDMDSQWQILVNTWPVPVDLVSPRLIRSRCIFTIKIE